MWVDGVHISFATATSLSPFNSVCPLLRRRLESRDVTWFRLVETRSKDATRVVSRRARARNAKIEWRKVVAVKDPAGGNGGVFNGN